VLCGREEWIDCPLGGGSCSPGGGARLPPTGQTLSRVPLVCQLLPTLHETHYPDWGDTGIRIRDSRRTKLDATVWDDWLKLTYEYDLGDSWMHQITIEKIERLTDESSFYDELWVTPRCLAGARACPPEDAGGISGYALLLEALQNPKHPEHEQMRQWAGAFYDPELFSVQQVNSALANLE